MFQVRYRLGKSAACLTLRPNVLTTDARRPARAFRYSRMAPYVSGIGQLKYCFPTEEFAASIAIDVASRRLVASQGGRCRYDHPTCFHAIIFCPTVKAPVAGARRREQVADGDVEMFHEEATDQIEFIA
jgi:hypothetical protein